MTDNTYNMLIAPDFSPERFAGWHMFNTLLQKRTGLKMHLNMPASHKEQESLVSDGQVHVIYANPFDATDLIRTHGYRAVARPINKSDEMVIATAADNDMTTLEHLPKGAHIAMADNRDVKLIGLRLLEAVDLSEDDLHWEITDTYQAAARKIIKGEAQAGFFLSEIYHGLSRLTKMQLQVLIESDIADISHVVLVKDTFDDAETFTNTLLDFNNDADGQAVLAELGFNEGFEAMSEEDAEFMLDLMETLLD